MIYFLFCLEKLGRIGFVFQKLLFASEFRSIPLEPYSCSCDGPKRNCKDERISFHLAYEAPHGNVGTRCYGRPRQLRSDLGVW